jgi:hypothetical protein
VPPLQAGAGRHDQRGEKTQAVAAQEEGQVMFWIYWIFFGLQMPFAVSVVEHGHEIARKLERSKEEK